MRHDARWAAAALLLLGCGGGTSGEARVEPDAGAPPSALLSPTDACPLAWPMDARQAQERLQALAACLGHAPGTVTIDCDEQTVWYDWDEVVVTGADGWIVGRDIVFCRVAFRGGQVPPHERLTGFELRDHTIPAPAVDAPRGPLPTADGCTPPERLPGAQADEVAAAYVEHLVCLGYPADQTAVHCWGPPTDPSDDRDGASVLCRVDVPAADVVFEGRVRVRE